MFKLITSAEMLSKNKNCCIPINSPSHKKLKIWAKIVPMLPDKPFHAWSHSAVHKTQATSAVVSP